MAKKQVQAPATAVAEGVLVNLNPSLILADDNSRFGLKKSRIESLAASIMERGEVMSPIEVEPLAEGAEPVDGKLYRLTAGFYRLAAVNFLNTEQNAGMPIPALVKPVQNPLDRRMRQLSENMERENQSPMDKAIAIQKLIQEGMPKPEIRKLFSTVGGRKGNQVQPASNSFINMTLSFLDLPKAIQEKIHDGRIGVAAAYQLTKVPAEKRQEVMDRVELERLKAIEQDEKDETKYLESEAKSAKDREKETAALKAIEEAKAAVAAAEAKGAELVEKATEAFKAAKTGAKDDKEKAKRAEALKAAEAAVKEADNETNIARKTLERLEGKVKTAAEHAKERAAKLADARKAAAKTAPAKTVGPEEVKKAAKASGASTEHVPLKAQEIRKIVEDMSAPGVFPKVAAIAKALQSCFNGVMTPGQLYSELGKITGEKTAKK